MKLEPWMSVGPDYQAAHEGAAVGRRGERRFIRVSGRSPGDMLKGILTGRIPQETRPIPGVVGGEDGAGVEDPLPAGPLSIHIGDAAYSALLTPKGRMVTDLRVLRDRGGSFLLELPGAGFGRAVEHLRRLLPPRLARFEDVSPLLRAITVVGPAGGAVLVEGLTGDPIPEGEVAFLTEGKALTVGGDLLGGITLIGSGDFRVPALDLLVPTPRSDEVWARLCAAGARPLSPDTWDVLQVEGGRPAFGVDMDQDTIPVEAGIHTRAIDHQKGCYTGQEVIVRIRDRGQVNKRLVGLLMGQVPPPPPGAGLHFQGSEKSVGWLTRSVFSPAFGERAGFAYLRKEVVAGERVGVGSENGPPARVVELGEKGWLLD